MKKKKERKEKKREKEARSWLGWILSPRPSWGMHAHLQSADRRGPRAASLEALLCHGGARLGSSPTRDGGTASSAST